MVSNTFVELFIQGHCYICGTNRLIPCCRDVCIPPRLTERLRVEGGDVNCALPSLVDFAVLPRTVRGEPVRIENHFYDCFDSAVTVWGIGLRACNSVVTCGTSVSVLVVLR